MNKNTHISRNNEVVYTQIDEDIVLMRPSDGVYYGINALGADIWNMLEADKLSLQTICEQLQQKYEVTEEKCVAEVGQFLETMVNNQMIFTE